MSDVENPYRAPVAADEDISQLEAMPERVAPWILVTWPFVFLANLAAPLTFAGAIVRDKVHGYLGVSAACALLLIAGWCVLIALRFHARSVLVGCGVIAASQLFPILQLLAGTMTIAIAQHLGFVKSPRATVDGGHFPIIDTVSGGFFVTLLVGSMLMTLGVGLGVLIQALRKSLRGRSASGN